jgi:hypothetical protein
MVLVSTKISLPPSSCQFLTYLVILSYEQIDELKSALGPLSARGEKYCSEACLTRYLEARNWNVTKSKKMLEESLKWRAAYRPEDIRWVNVLKLLFFSES